MSSISTSPRRRPTPSPRRSRRSPHASPSRQARRRDRKRRRRQTRKAHAARRMLQRLHQALPQPARGLFDVLAGGCTRPTFLRLLVRARATILTVGGRGEPPPKAKDDDKRKVVGEAIGSVTNNPDKTD